jgi:hypothetical protein
LKIFFNFLKIFLCFISLERTKQNHLLLQFSFFVIVLSSMMTHHYFFMPDSLEKTLNSSENKEKEK